MQLTIEMPVVNECAASECAYNVNHGCHARAITIGEPTHPGCDTFLKSSVHAKNYQENAGVGACKATNCSHNIDFECTIDEIRVGYADKEINCLSYTIQ